MLFCCFSTLTAFRCTTLPVYHDSPCFRQPFSQSLAGPSLHAMEIDSTAPTLRLEDAVLKGSLSCLRSLIQQGADVNDHNAYRLSPLSLASRAGRLDMVQSLLEGGAHATTQTLNGYTPLHFAAARGHDDIAETLILSGADVQARDFEGREPFDLAVCNGHHGVAAALIACASGAEEYLRSLQVEDAHSGEAEISHEKQGL
mmetsp:Transcript_33528/g.52176  ORF Transcript_33528/g.52176 Transcript_33528/m.52176 type:complete len:201 (-) Transcript_33528:130-732(-)